MTDTVNRTSSEEMPAKWLRDQYADGEAARVWKLYVGARTPEFKKWLLATLREHSCQNLLDVACGDGIDSIILLEEGFNVTSTDGSDQMLKYALRERWLRRKEEAFDKWVIEEANWLSLSDDLKDVQGMPECGFDAVFCLGNSFAHMPDFEGVLRNQKVALANFWGMVKPGGILVIDHRNFDEVLSNERAPIKNMHFITNCTMDIQVSITYTNSRPTLTTFDYTLDIPNAKNQTGDSIPNDGKHKFRLSYYPHRLADFSKLLKGVFGEEAKHSVFGDFQALGRVERPAFYIHVVQKSMNPASQ